MTVTLAYADSQLILRAAEPYLASRHKSQIQFWGFELNAEKGAFILSTDDPLGLIVKIKNYLDKNDKILELDTTTEKIYKQYERGAGALAQAIHQGRSFKDGDIDIRPTNDFITFMKNEIPRTLKDHQIKAALHLLNVQNGANFSVPGAGKTTVVLSVFQYLKSRGELDSLFVVGPPACFGPWISEYEMVLGERPKYEILAGGDVDDRREQYKVSKADVLDLYLTTFQTLQRDWPNVRNFMRLHGINVYLVVDEAHYIKQPGGQWADAVLNIAGHSKKRCILTGTPFPKSFTDAFNLFDVLWPESPPISEQDRHKIHYFSKHNQSEKAGSILDEKIGPLFYRVRKNDLHLADQIFHDPVIINMNEKERQIYDAIVEHVKKLSESDYKRNFDILMRLRQGRMMRLRQCISYIPLLKTAIPDYDEELITEIFLMSNIISNYDEIERPAKIDKMLELVNVMRNRDEKAVVWSNFIETLKLIKSALERAGHNPELIYGATPTQNSTVTAELTREEVIRRFVKPNGGIDILVANPAACAESISLHKTCSNAIYYDLSYNCAQYLQSLDRIHRVGGSEDKEAHYYFLLYANTIDQDILLNVRKKAHNMYSIIDKDYAVYSLDMFEGNEELEAYERLFGKD